MIRSTTRRSARRAGLIAASLAASVALVLSGCATETPAASDDEASYGDINVQLSWLKNTEFAGEYLAVEDGFFEEAGFGKVTLVAGGSGATSAIAAVSTGQAAVGLSGPLQIAPAILEGAEVRIIATGFQKNPFNITSLVDNPISEPKDMIGKTIAVSDSNILVFNAMLDSNDIDPSEINVVPFSDISQLTTGQVDGYLGYTTSGPYALELQGYEAQEFLLADYGMAIVSENYVATVDMIENERELLKAYLAALIRGWHVVLNDLERATDLTVNKYGAEQNYDYDQQLNALTVQKGLMITPDTEANGLLTMTDELIAANIATLALCGFDITADELFDMSLIEEVYAENPDLLTW